MDATELLLQVLRMALPLLLAALAELIIERAGHVNLGIEGMMIAGALSAYLVGAGQPPAYLALAWLAALAVGAVLGLVSAWFTTHLKADSIVAGTALHLIAFGTTGWLFERYKSSQSVVTFAQLPGAWPVFPYVFAACATLATGVLLYHTGVGLRLRAAGESPRALRAAGGSAERSRTFAWLLAGMLSALAGATLTTVLTGEFVEGMTSGRGFLALSLVIFGRWSTLGTLLAALFISLTFAIEIHLTSGIASSARSATRDLWIFLLRALPYFTTLAALALLGMRQLRAPAALGRTEEE